jgi:D-serine deaminase-like pyridoxal phosphate-dependent protein
VFHDAGYSEKYADLKDLMPAARLLTRVISRPTPNRVTWDLGTKAVASDPPMGQRVCLPEVSDAVQVLHNEEHLVIETALADRFRPGDWTLAIPRHVCPTIALHASATVIENGEIVDDWEVTARNRKITI